MVKIDKILDRCHRKVGVTQGAPLRPKSPIEINKCIFIVDKSKVLTMQNYMKIDAWAHMEPPTKFGLIQVSTQVPMRPVCIRREVHRNSDGDTPSSTLCEQIIRKRESETRN